MAVKAKYTQPIQVVATQEMRDELKEISDIPEHEMSMAAVIREAIDAGLPVVRQRRGL